MERRFEYRFVRLNGKSRKTYREAVEQFADEGWRLVQVFAPGAGGLWARANYIELILERDRGA